jgi:hypothetical protein
MALLQDSSTYLDGTEAVRMTGPIIVELDFYEAAVLCADFPFRSSHPDAIEEPEDTDTLEPGGHINGRQGQEGGCSCTLGFSLSWGLCRMICSVLP